MVRVDRLLRLLLLSLLLFSVFTPQAEGVDKTRFVMEWDTSKLPISVRTVLAPKSMNNRISEMGVYNDSTPLPVAAQLPKGEVELGPNDEAIVYLLVRNDGKEAVTFSVAPHSTHPGGASLGFHFNCLCNGHIYEVAPGKIWYRVMQLKTTAVSQPGKVVLKHHIFKAKKI